MILQRLKLMHEINKTNAAVRLFPSLKPESRALMSQYTIVKTMQL